MKKILALLLASAMLFTLAGCKETDDKDSDNTQSSSSAPKEAKSPSVAEDDAVMMMRFDPPKSYQKVSRYVVEDNDGSVDRKVIMYTLSDDKEIMYAYQRDTTVKDVLANSGDIGSAETKEHDGKTFRCLYSDDCFEAFAQVGGDVYAVRYLNPSGKEESDKTLEGVSFTDADTTLTNDRDLFDITYEIDKSLPLCGCTTNAVANPDGKVLEKSVIWEYGENRNDLDFSFMITVYRDSDLSDQLDSDYDYRKKTVNGIEYAVLTPDEDKADYDYYTRHGDDVYRISNLGVTKSWSTKRSKESEEAFDAFVNSIEFSE